MRIFIIGSSGSGKTYAAEKLSNLFNIKNYELDDIYWDNSSTNYNTKSPEKKRNKKLFQITNKKDWIIEGAYTKEWVYPCFSKADYIILLNPAAYLRDKNMVVRFIKRKFNFSKSKKESIQGIVSLIKWNHNYNRDKIQRINDLIKKFNKKGLYFNKADNAVKHFRNIINKSAATKSEKS